MKPLSYNQILLGILLCLPFWPILALFKGDTRPEWIYQGRQR